MGGSRFYSRMGHSWTKITELHAYHILSYFALTKFSDEMHCSSLEVFACFSSGFADSLALFQERSWTASHSGTIRSKNIVLALPLRLSFLSHKSRICLYFSSTTNMSELSVFFLVSSFPVSKCKCGLGFSSRPEI